MAANEKPQPGTAAEGMGVAKQGWFTELSTMWPGQGLSLKVEEILYQGRSKFQDVCVFQSPSFGKVLLLDGVIQCTERDEFSYQEMIAHIPLCALEKEPQKVLVVGGGDGGVLREVARHPGIQEIHLAEIDEMVPATSKKFFPEMALGFDDPRVRVHITDGIKFVQEAAEGTYDAIIVDSSDPVGPAEVLFQKPFFEAMHRALKPGGMVCTQGESLWLHLEIIKSLAAMCHEVFVGGTVQYAYTTIPTYPSGQIGFMVCAKGTGKDFKMNIPRRTPPSQGPSGYPPLRYYTEQIHQASFTLPKFAHDGLKGSLSTTL
ncbi:g12391 [Coccomyxa viridis]|uniref:spermidine synthase n=1 Tax=Coccomyxa viridis TaxID=1274662 RepID=A0ABP1GA83_9CHLO